MLFAFGSFVKADDILLDRSDKIFEENVDMKVAEYDYIIDVDLVNNATTAGCTVDADITVETEGGDSINIRVTVKADTCKEAIRVLMMISDALDQ